jgi:hypothetical protein
MAAGYGLMIPHTFKARFGACEKFHKVIRSPAFARNYSWNETEKDRRALITRGISGTARHGR